MNAHVNTQRVAQDKALRRPDGTVQLVLDVPLLGGVTEQHLRGMLRTFDGQIDLFRDVAEARVDAT